MSHYGDTVQMQDRVLVCSLVLITPHLPGWWADTMSHKGCLCCLVSMTADNLSPCLSARLGSWNLDCERTLWPGALYGAHLWEAKGRCLCLNHW